MLPSLNPRMAQRGKEYHTWIALCLALEVHRYVELGSWDGSSSTFAREAGIKQVVTIDLSSARPSALLDDMGFVSGDCGTLDALQRALDFLGGSPDAVFIDADHSEGAVRRDFSLWWPKTKILLGFHDILGFGVEPFWREISSGIRSVEIVSRDKVSESEFHHNESVHWAGIGVLFKEEV